jgi:hypothetical protein
VRSCPGFFQLVGGPPGRFGIDLLPIRAGKPINDVLRAGGCDRNTTQKRPDEDDADPHRDTSMRAARSAAVKTAAGIKVRAASYK